MLCGHLRKIYYFCVQEWLVRMGCSDADITSIKEGFKEALGKPILAVLSFREFAQTFSWFASTLHMMSQVLLANNFCEAWCVMLILQLPVNEQH